MPELPEVETMVRGLRPALTGARLVSLEVRDPMLRAALPDAAFRRLTAGPTVLSVARRGKWVVIDLGVPGGIIVIQPRMTGGFRLDDPDRPEHVRAVFRIDRPPQAVWFCDTRRLGKLDWFESTAAADAAIARSLGPDALDIAHDQLAARLRRTTRAIKPAIMDQKVLAGIGNIYADELLFRARLHPLRPSHRLRADQVRLLHSEIRPLLEQAIAAEGSSFDAGYRTVLGLEGGFLNQNAIHRRAGLPCPSCGGPILKTRIAGLAGRPTYLCPRCQPAPRRPRTP
jgi:formamidopyrimidine-DNA glycosylase